MQAPRTVTDVRRLTGCVAALSRFISKSAERALPLFNILKKAGPMKWTPEVDVALQELKTYLSSMPTLVAPKPQEPLLLYLATTNQVVSAALVDSGKWMKRQSQPLSPLERKENPSQQGQMQFKTRESKAVEIVPSSRQGRRWCSA